MPAIVAINLIPSHPITPSSILLIWHVKKLITIAAIGATNVTRGTFLKC